MNGLFDLGVARPVLTAAINLLLIALGLAAIVALPIREYPDIDPPTVSVRTQYVGAPAEIVEREVTKIIEDNLSGIEGVRLIQSTSRNEASSINIEFTAGTDIDAAAADVRDKVSSVRNELPDDVEEPTIEKANADDQPMMYITLQSDSLSTPALTDLADRLLVDALGVVEGVARIQIGGEKRYAMRVWLDRRAMAARGVTPGEVAERLRAENVEAPAGRLETGTQELTVRAETRFANAAEFAGLAIRDRDGDRVTLGDIARVEVGVEEYRSGLRANGREAISLGIIRQSNANTLSVADGIKTELERVRASVPPNVRMTIDYDESIFIRETLKNVATTLLQTVAVIVAVLWLFLGSWRATVIPALTIPASVIPAFIVAAALGFSINVLSILAVILAISLCTDDAVVIAENTRRRQQSGEPPPVAAARATRQVGFAVFASAAVLVAVILPLAFIQGNVGRLFREFAVVLAAVVVFSTFAALTIAPLLAAKLFRDDEKPNRVTAWVEARMQRLGEGYRRLLERCFDRPLVPIGATLAFVAACVAALLATRTELAPTEDRGALRIRIEGPEGTGFDYTLAKVREVERAIAPFTRVPEEQRDEDAVPPVRGTLAIVAPGFGGASTTNSAFLIVRLADWADREQSQEELQERIQAALRPITGVRAFATAGPSLGQRRRGQQFQLVVGGIDRAEVVRWSRALLNQAKGVEGLRNPDLDYKDTRPQVTLTLDRARAAALGIDAGAIGDALQIMFGSLQVTRYTERGEEYDVILQAANPDRRAPDDIRQVYVRAQSGQLVPLSSVVTLREEGTVRELTRVDRQAAVTLEAGLLPDAALGDIFEQLEGIARDTLPSSARLSRLGEGRDLQETGASLYLLLGLVMVLVYLVLAGQFESFVHPLVVLLSVPVAVGGGVLTAWALGQSINIYTQIALVLLVGLTAKNAILLIEFANQQRAEGRDARQAMLKAAEIRLRPILITSLATILGAVPLILESGAGAEARGTVGLVTTGGLTFGTLLTLFIVPTGYVLLGRFTSAPDAAAEELRKQEAEHPDGDASEDEDGPNPREQGA